MERFSWESEFSVVCDRGFGNVYSRSADTIEEAQAELEKWRKDQPGEFRIQRWNGELISGNYMPTPNWW